MTLVNAETGEVFLSLTAEDARAITERIKVGVEAVWHLIVQAYNGGAHRALGYASWDDYCTREFGTSRLRLPREERQEVVASLRESGLSIRAIAAVTGHDTKTVQADLRQVSESPTPDVTPMFKQSTVKGLDGKTYPTTTERMEAAKAKHPQPSGSGLSRAEVEAKVKKAREMAASGSTSPQIADAIGIAESGMANFRKRHGIDVPADKLVSRKKIDLNRVVEETVLALEGWTDDLGNIDVDALDPSRFDDWLDSLRKSRTALTQFLNKFPKETSQ